MVTAASGADRKRIIDHGEVFTPPELVNNMLDLVAPECEREDSRFLEPACGDGNFLAEVLRRRLATANRKYRAQHLWEAHALLGLACLYGIELLPDNTQLCRERLSNIFKEYYEARYESSTKGEVTSAAHKIVHCNIVQGDALTMTDANGAPIVLSEWALIGRGKFKRRVYEYRELTPAARQETESLFSAPREMVENEDGHPVFIAQLLQDVPAIHYRALAIEVHRL